MSAEPENTPEGAPEWMVSYADMITIMMAFFVVMFAMSGTQDPKKEDPVITSLHKQFGRVTNTPNVLKVPRNSNFVGVGKGHSPKATAPDMAASVDPAAGEGRATSFRPGDQLTLGGVIWFDGLESVLDDQQHRQLKAIAREFSGKPQRIDIRGHTTTKALPDDAPYRDHWDLAYARCHSAMVYLVSCGIDAKRLRISVAGPNEPLTFSVENSVVRRNGRVEVLMLNELAEEMQGAARVTRKARPDAEATGTTTF